jgi:hypothetical protein
MTNLPTVKLLSPDNCGCSQTACNIVNNTFMSLDGFAPLRLQMNDDTTYPAFAFAAELARITDREIRFQAEKEAAEKAAEDEMYRESEMLIRARAESDIRHNEGYERPVSNYRGYFNFV